MDKTKRKVLALTIVSMLLLSTTAQQVIAWPCDPPPCPPCHTCTETCCEPYGDCWGGCPSCESCVSCWCQCTSECGCDGKTCSGCCSCSGCSCVPDDSLCGFCEQCNSNCQCECKAGSECDCPGKQCAAPKVCAACECICIGCVLKSVDFCRLMQSNCMCYHFAIPPGPPGISPCLGYVDIDPGVVWDCELACNDKTCDYDGKAVCYSWRECTDSGDYQSGKRCSIDGMEGHCTFWPTTICVTCIPYGETYYDEVTNFKCE